MTAWKQAHLLLQCLKAPELRWRVWNLCLPLSKEVERLGQTSLDATAADTAPPWITVPALGRVTELSGTVLRSWVMCPLWKGNSIE